MPLRVAPAENVREAEVAERVVGAQTEQADGPAEPDAESPVNRRGKRDIDLVGSLLGGGASNRLSIEIACSIEQAVVGQTHVELRQLVRRRRHVAGRYDRGAKCPHV